jgi:hypothetical protein
LGFAAFVEYLSGRAFIRRTRSQKVDLVGKAMWTALASDPANCCAGKFPAVAIALKKICLYGITHAIAVHESHRRSNQGDAHD